MIEINIRENEFPIDGLIEQYILDGGKVERGTEYTFIYKIINDNEIEKVYGNYDVIRFK